MKTKHQGEICLLMHFKELRRQSGNKEIADFGKPCATCEFWESCQGDWLGKISNIMKRAGIKISMVEMTASDPENKLCRDGEQKANEASNINTFKKAQPTSLRKAMRSLQKFPESELCEIYIHLNCWDWDSRIGKMPDGYDEMPLYHGKHGIIKSILGIPTRSDYITPYLAAITLMVPEKELLRHHHTRNLKRSNDEFEAWWINEYLPRANRPELNRLL